MLHTRGEWNLNGLADELAVNASTAMRMIDKLLAAGLVTRQDNPANRREVQLAVTEAGARLASAPSPVAAAQGSLVSSLQCPTPTAPD